MLHQLGSWVNETTQSIKTRAAKPDYLSLSRRIGMMEDTNCLL